MQQGRDGVVDSKQAEVQGKADPLRGPPRSASQYVVRADLGAGTVSVLWPAEARRRPTRSAPRRARGQKGRSSS